MRIYGTSPLYNWVELVFRCKRMFIFAIILGTLITSFVVYTRATSYEATILVALTGDPEMQASLNGGTGPRENEITPARRKANRLAIWIQRTPDFLNEVVQNAQIEKKYPGKSVEELSRDIRKHLSEPTLLNDQYMEIKLTWPNAEEAEAILNRLYARFSEKTVATETFTASRKRQVLEAQLVESEKDWNAAAKARVTHQVSNYFTQPAMLASMQGQWDQSQRHLSAARYDLNEARSRLEDVSKQLESTPEKIDQGTETAVIQVDPALGFKQELSTLMSQKKDLLNTYSEIHPKVQELDRKIASVTAQLDEVKNEKPQRKEQTKTTRTIINPDWQDLHSQKLSLEQTVHALEGKVLDVERDLKTADTRMKGMPDQEVKNAVVERNYQMADAIKRLTQNQLAAARLEEQKDKITQALAVHLDVPPKSERTDSGGKVAMLYALGPMLGILIAFIFSLAVESLDHTLRTPVEVEKYLGKPVLAVIPRMQSARESRRKIAATSKSSITS